MATCLRCDNCSKVVTEQDDELVRWWSLERYGSDWIDEPGRPRRSSPTVEMHSVIIDSRSMEMPQESDSAALEEAMMDEYIEDSHGMAVDLTLHFCTANCLTQWATQASAFDD